MAKTEIKDKLSARAFAMDYIDGPADPPTEWYATELHGEPLSVALDTIGPITQEMHSTLLDLYTFYTSNGSRVFMAFEYDFNQDDIVSYLVLPGEVFDKLYEWQTHEFDIWNQVTRKALDDDEPPVKMEPKKKE